MCTITSDLWIASMLPKEDQMKKLETCWFQVLRSMIRGGWLRCEPENDGSEEYRFMFTNRRIEELMKTLPLRDFINSQYLKYIGHICRMENYCLPKIMLFAVPTKSHFRDPWLNISEMLGISADQAKKMTQSRPKFAGLIQQVFNPPL